MILLTHYRTKSFGIHENLGELPVGVLLGAGAVNLLHVHLPEGGQAAGALMLLAQVDAVVLIVHGGLKREKGNITIFALDEGQGFSEHTAPFDALVQAVEGGCW